MTVTAAAVTASPVTIVTAGLMATAAAVSALTPIVLARRRSRKDAFTAAATAAGDRGDLTLAGWTALNGALQQEVSRLQAVTERMQGKIDALETELETLRKAIGGRGPPHA